MITARQYASVTAIGIPVCAIFLLPKTCLIKIDTDWICMFFTFLYILVRAIALETYSMICCQRPVIFFLLSNIILIVLIRWLILGHFLRSIYWNSIVCYKAGREGSNFHRGSYYTRYIYGTRYFSPDFSWKDRICMHAMVRAKFTIFNYSIT